MTRLDQAAGFGGWLVLIAACSRQQNSSAAGETKARPAPAVPVSAPVAVAPPAAPPKPLLAAVVLDSGAAFRAWARTLGPQRLTLILKLNRIDLGHARAGDTVVVPADTTLGPADLAPFPARLPVLDSVPKLIAVSRRVQAFAAYDSGRLVRWGPTSTGKRTTPTPAGLFFTTWKAKQTRSTDNAAWLLNWYFNFDNQRGVSFHEYALPGVPASHSCVRLLADDAKWLYDWARQWKLSPDQQVVTRWGTPVVVFDEYDFKAPPPWRRMAVDPGATAVSTTQLDSLMTGYLPTIRPRQPVDSAAAPIS